MGKSNCYICKHKRNVAGNAHIACVNPDKEVRGVSHGIRNGWFDYPFLYDPTWMANDCRNFEEFDLPKTQELKVA